RREMTDPTGGGFYSAEDADSVPPEGPADAEKREGAFFLWRAAEIDELLGADASIVKLRYGIEPDGNAPHDPQQEFTGKNLLYVARSVADIAAQTGQSNDQVIDALNRARVRMFEKRLERPRPHRDDKILTAWNGLMIAAFARMARALDGLGRHGRSGAAHYLAAAAPAASFLLRGIWERDPRGLLLR